MTNEQAALKLSLHLMQCGALMPIKWVEANGYGSELSNAFQLAVSTLRAKATPNPPLTLEELRGMGDELVWVEDWYTEQPCAGCSVVKRASDALTFAGWRDTDYCGKWWLAYRRKPEVTP